MAQGDSLSSGPKASIDLDGCVDCSERTGRTTHTGEAQPALRGIFLQTVERQPKIVPVILLATGFQQGFRANRGILTEAKITGDRGKLHHLIILQVDTRPHFRISHGFLHVDEESIGQYVRHFLSGSRVMREGSRRYRTLRDHRTVGANEAEHAHDDLEPRTPIVRVQQVNTRDQSAQTLRGDGIEVFVQHGDHMLTMVAASLALLLCARLGDLPATGLESLDIFQGRNHLVPARNVFRRSRSVNCRGKGDRALCVLHVGSYRVRFQGFKREVGYFLGRCNHLKLKDLSSMGPPPNLRNPLIYRGLGLPLGIVDDTGEVDFGLKYRTLGHPQFVLQGGEESPTIEIVQEGLRLNRQTVQVSDLGAFSQLLLQIREVSEQCLKRGEIVLLFVFHLIFLWIFVGRDFGIVKHISNRPCRRTCRDRNPDLRRIGRTDRSRRSPDPRRTQPRSPRSSDRRTGSRHPRPSRP